MAKHHYCRVPRICGKTILNHNDNCIVQENDQQLQEGFIYLVYSHWELCSLESFCSHPACKQQRTRKQEQRGVRL